MGYVYGKVYGYVYGICLHGRSRLPKVYVYGCIHICIDVGVWDIYMGYIYEMYMARVGSLNAAVATHLPYIYICIWDVYMGDAYGRKRLPQCRSCDASA